MAGMMGDDMKAAMKEYQNSLETMSSEAVEYIRGVPVVKTFGQTIFSFERFRKAIDEYSKWTIAYTKSMRPVSYTHLIDVLKHLTAHQNRSLLFLPELPL